MSVFAAGRQLPEDEGAVNVSAPEATSHTDLWQNLDVWQKEVVPHLDFALRITKFADGRRREEAVHVGKPRSLRLKKGSMPKPARPLVRILSATIFLACCTALVCGVNPIWRQAKYNVHPLSYLARVYLTTSVGLLVVYLLTGWIIIISRVTNRLALQPSVFFLATVIGSIYLGTRTIDEQQWFPNVLSEVHAQFFAEWQFVNFIVLVLLPLSVVAILINGVVRRHSPR
jgi:hypothetical protein